MVRSANRGTNEIETPHTSAQILFANLIGGGAGNLTLDASETLYGEIRSGTRTGAGTGSAPAISSGKSTVPAMVVFR